MKVIGFAGKYYTLWEVSSTTQDFGNGRSYEWKCFTYLKNISQDKEKALAKYPNTDMDEELRGRTKSFKVRREVWTNVDTFRFGKYFGQKITDVNDVDYTAWYWGTIAEDHKAYVGNYLVKNGYEIRSFSDGSEFLVSPEELAKEIESQKQADIVMKKINNNEALVINPISNLGEDATFIGDGNIIYQFPGVAQYWYQGCPYYLPVLNGKSKRIKNKTVEIDNYTVETQEDGRIIVNIINFKVLK